MSCPNCRSELPIQYGFCPACKAFVGSGSGPEPPQEKRFWLLASLGLILVLSLTYFLISMGWLRIYITHAARPITHAGKPAGIVRDRPVVHGDVASLDELRGHGKLYFVPMGTQAIPVQVLADYYRKKFKLDIKTLSEVKLGSSTCVPSRQQCVAEEMLDDMCHAYPELSDNPDSVMIILTDEDIFARSLDWDFTTSFRSGYRFGVVSTRRMGTDISGGAPDDGMRLANTKQMLTKYIALLYFRLTPSHDPSSIMYQPLIPNGGPDDIYESDVHPEESANGLTGNGWACISLHYSYKTGKIEPTTPLVTDCFAQEEAQSPEDEIIQAELNTGVFVDHSMEFALNSTPRIELRRGYRSDWVPARALGFGTDYNYDTYLSSDGIDKLSFINIQRPDTHFSRIVRDSPGRGFSPDIVFQNRGSDGEKFGPRMTWESDHFKLQYQDGSWFTYLPCHNDADCYWIGYEDDQKKSLSFDRDSHRTLRHLTANDGQGVEFQVDDQQRVVQAKASNGTRVRYEYDNGGGLAKVVRADRLETLYNYDSAHHMTGMAATAKPGGVPRMLISPEYDSDGYIQKLKVAGVGTYRIQYAAVVAHRATRVRITEPSGRVWDVSLSDQRYTAQTTPIRFPALPAPHQGQN